MASLGSSSQTVTEYVVRVPKNTPKRYNIMAFNAADKVNFATWHQARMERDLSQKRLYQEEEAPESGAGSEFHRKLREEARRRRLGMSPRVFRAQDQPWVLRVCGRGGRRYRGGKKGGVTENASYYVFTQCPDGAFEAFPVQHWYNFTPLAKHRTLTAEEAEEEWERRNKVLNHFSIMQQRRLRDQDEEEEEKGRKGPGKGGELRIHDLEEDLELSSEESGGSEAEGGEKPPKAPSGGKGKGRKRKRKRKGSEEEALEDSDDGDFEGQEVDYMSDGSSSSQEEQEKGKATKEEDGPKGIDEASESSEESEEEEKVGEEKEEEEEEKKAPTPQEKKKKKDGASPPSPDSSEESQSSEESDIDSEASSALFMAKKKTPPKRERRGSGGSSRGSSRPGTPTDPGGVGSTLRAAAARLEQGRRVPPGGSEPPPPKRLKLEPGPPSGKSTPSSGEVQLTEEAVRRYLSRKPMTTKDLLKKFQTKRTGLSSDATVNVLAQILKRLNPERKIIGEKMHFFLKE